MKKVLTLIFTLLLAFTPALAVQDGTDANLNASSGLKTGKKRGPVFRASKEQIKQAQTMLKQRGIYVGEPTGKLDRDTRAALKQYQAAENMKVTGTLNRPTLERMNITLTDKQRMM